MLCIRDILVRIRMRIREVQKHSDPIDLDPEYWYIYIIPPRYKVRKKSQNQGFSYYFCLMMEGSGAGSVLVTN